MLFQLSAQQFPNAIQTTAIPEEYADIALLHHKINVTIDDACTLIHQTIQDQGYSFWINNFFINRPLSLYVLPMEKMYSLYYSIENVVRFSIPGEVKKIPPKEFCLLELSPGFHYGKFDKGTYRSLHITVDEPNKEILQDREYVAALLREHYLNSAFQPQ
jgi:hypothetical protein